MGKAVKYHQNMSESKSKTFYEKYGDQLMDSQQEIRQKAAKNVKNIVSLLQIQMKIP